MSHFALRLPDSLHDRARDLAARDRTSLNQFITLAVAEKVATLDATRFFHERAARDDLARLHEILDDVPDAPVQAGDERY